MNIPNHDVFATANELIESLSKEEGLSTTLEQLAEHGAYINWMLNHVSIRAALEACLVDDDCWESLVVWLKNPDRPKAGCDWRAHSVEPQKPTMTAHSELVTRIG